MDKNAEELTQSEYHKILTMLNKIDKDLSVFKANMSEALRDTNGKLKGNHELLILKLDAHEKQNELQIQNITTEVRSIGKEVERNKDSISNLYDKYRENAKNSDDKDSYLLQKVDEKVTGFVERLEKRMNNIESCSQDMKKHIEVNDATNQAQKKMIIGMFVLFGPFVITGVISAIVLYGKLQYILEVLP